MPPGPDPTFEQQLVAHRDYLLKFARLQLRNESWAEDAVSETIVAALSKPQAFGNRSQLKTWLVCILDITTLARLLHFTGALVADDITAQTRRALQNLLAVLSAAGGAPRDLVKTTIFMTDLGEFPTVNEIYREVLGAEPPARATVQVAALPLGARIEIDGIAVLPPA